MKICLRQIKSILNEKEDGDQLRPIEVHDIVCHIADAVLAGEFKPGDTAVVDLNNDEIQVTSESPLPVAPKQKN